MKSFAARAIIQAPGAMIWTILTDASGYPSWNSTVEKIVGHIALGQKLTVHARAASGRAFPVKVSECDAPRRMVWTGGMPFGLFTGQRTFTLTPHADGNVLFEMREVFAGVLAPLITRSIPDLQPAFDTFAADLKRRAESAG